MRRPIEVLDKLAFLDGFGGALVSASTAGNTDIGIDDVLAVALGNSAHGALIGASAAIQTSVSVDLVLAITLGNSANRASIGASAASDAIVGNLISHGMYLLFKFGT